MTDTSYITDNASDSPQIVNITGTGIPAQTTPTVSVTPSSSSITAAQELTVTVAVNAAGGNLTPTGSVTLTSIGYTSPAIPLSGGSATIPVAAGLLGTGTDTLTATYSGDGNYTSSSGSTLVTVSTGTAGDFGTVAIGQTSAVMPLTLTFDTSGTIGSSVALTQGVGGLDFTVVGTGTCATGTYYGAGAPAR